MTAQSGCDAPHTLNRSHKKSPRPAGGDVGVFALAPRLGVWKRVSRDALDCLHQAVCRGGLAELFQHYHRRPKGADRVGDTLAHDVEGQATDRPNVEGKVRSGLRLAVGAMPSEPATAAAKSDRIANAQNGVSRPTDKVSYESLSVPSSARGQVHALRVNYVFSFSWALTLHRQSEGAISASTSRMSPGRRTGRGGRSN